MRILIAKFSALGLVGSLAFAVLPNASAQAQVLPPGVINALTTAGNSSASGAQIQAAGAALVAALNSPDTSPQQAAAIIQALAATGNANLISTVLSAPGVSPSVQTTLAAAVVAGGNATAIANVVILASNDGKSGAVAAMANALATSTNAQAVASAITIIGANNPTLGTNFGNTVQLAALTAGNSAVALAASSAAAATALLASGPSSGTGAPTINLPSPAQNHSTGSPS